MKKRPLPGGFGTDLKVRTLSVLGFQIKANHGGASNPQPQRH
jgi:hypothetical protein